MTESKRNTVSIRIYEETAEDLRDLQAARRKATRIEPTFAELASELWRAYQSKSTGAIGATLSENSTASTEIRDTVDIFDKVERQSIEMLLEILRSGDAEMIQRVRRLLSGYAGVVRAEAEETSRHPVSSDDPTSHGSPKFGSVSETMRGGSSDPHPGPRRKGGGSAG